MRSLYFLIIILFLAGVFVSGCRTTEQRLVNLEESVRNIAFDGDGVN